MSIFLNIRSSRLEVSCEKSSDNKSFTKFIEKYPDAVFNLIKFQAKGLQLYWREIPVYVLSSEFCRRF